MMTKPLLAILLLLPLSVSAGELDGKSLICRMGTPTFNITGTEFRDGHIIAWWIDPNGSERELKQYAGGEYSVSTDQIRWRPLDDLQESDVIVDRETLRLGAENQLDNSMGPKGTLIWIAQCEWVESLDILRATVEAEGKELQRKNAS